MVASIAEALVEAWGAGLLEQWADVQNGRLIYSLIGFDRILVLQKKTHGDISVNYMELLSCIQTWLENSSLSSMILQTKPRILLHPQWDELMTDTSGQQCATWIN